MSLSAATTEKPPRRTVPLKPREVKPRHPGAYLALKRLFDLREGQDRWEILLKAGLDPILGSKVGVLQVQGHLTAHQADAAIYFAKFCAAADHYAGTPKRNAMSPAYEKGFMNSRNDEVAVAILQGTINEYEKRAQRVQRKWDRIHGYLGDEKVFSLLLDVCVHNEHCPVMEIPKLRAALELLVIKLGIDRIRPEDQPRMKSKKRYRKPKQEDRNDRRRDPSSYYSRDREDIQLIPPAAKVPEPQDS